MLNTRVTFVLLLTAVSAISLSAAEETHPKHAARQAIPPDGTIIVWGGGDVPQALLNRLTRAADGRSAAVVTQAKQSEFLRALEQSARKRNVALQRIDANLGDLARRLLPFAAVWVDVTALPLGVSPLDQVFFSPEFEKDAPAPPLVLALERRPGQIGAWIPPETALVASGRHLEVIGRGPVALCLPPSATRAVERPLLLKRLSNRDQADLVALSRAAIARLGPRFPPLETATVQVPGGTLLACGGGELSESIWRRFIELAGGPEAPIVVLPIATPEPDDPRPRGLEVLKRLGCRDVTILHQRSRKDIESVAFANALRRARGVWFAGGRQWKYVDAYEGTVAEQLFRDVLHKGGVIGGSSAGAAIQAQFMVRGDPLGNKNIMAEGYERGLGLLPGTAIDIHVAQRGRLNEMFDVIKLHPQLLGIALDEGIAAEIHGSVMTLLGSGKAHIVHSGNPDATSLQVGDQYELAQRKKLP